jgi:hypothetical protein
MKEPSKVRWMSPSKVCQSAFCFGTMMSIRKNGKTMGHVVRSYVYTVYDCTYEPDEGDAVLPRRIFGEQCALRGERENQNGRDAGKRVCRCHSENRVG